MTGYSRVSQPTPHGTVTVEIRSTNHRFLEVEQRVPDGLAGFEGELAQVIRKHVRRGRVDVTVTLQPTKRATRRLLFDEQLAQTYYESLVELKSRFGLRGEITLDQLLSHPNLLNVKDERAKPHELWPAIRQGAQAALRELLTMRRTEGERLVRDIRAQAQLIAKRVSAIRTHLPKSMAQQKHRLWDRLRGLMGSAVVMSAAQVHEALLLLKDVDVHEELVRLESHLTHIEQALSSQQAVGKKLDFISQELTREANTLGAKANDRTVIRYVIEIKGAIEKIREQAQNLE